MITKEALRASAAEVAELANRAGIAHIAGRPAHLTLYQAEACGWTIERLRAESGRPATTGTGQADHIGIAGSAIYARRAKDAGHQPATTSGAGAAPLDLNAIGERTYASRAEAVAAAVAEERLE